MMAEANFEDFMMDDAADGNGNDDDEDGGGGVGICVDVDGSGIPAGLKATYLGPAGDDEDDEGGTNSASSSRRQQQQQQQQQHGKQGHGLQTQPSVCGGGGGGGGAGGSIVVGEGSSRKEFRRCVICQDVTERRHLNYGADACFSCRAFFRRTHQKRQPPSFECKGSGDCEVTARTRRRCQSCRYDRCLRAGMRPEFVMGEEQRMARMEKCRRKRQDREQRSGGMRSGGGSGGGSGGAAGGRNVVNGDGEKRDAKRGRKRPKKVEVKEELMGEEEESYLLQLAEVAARQVGLDDEEEDIKPVGNEGSEMIRVKKEEGEEDEDEEEEEAKPPPLFAPSSNPFTLQYRQRWHSSAGDLAFLRDRRGYNSQDVLGDVDAMATGNSSSGGSSNTTLQLRQQHAPMPPQRFFSLDHDHRPSSSSLASSFHDVQSSSSESWDQWRGYFSSQQQQQQHGHYGQQQQQQQQHQMMPPRHHQHHQHQQQHQIGQGSGDVPSAINTEQELNDIASVLSSQQNIEQQQQQQQQFHHQQHQQQGEQDDQDSLLLLSSTPSELESNVSLLTAELEVAQRLAVKKNPGESSNKSVLASSSCHSFSSSSSSASFSASASASASASVSVSASASGCPICREHGPSRRRVLSGWHATVSSFLSPDPDFLQAIIRTHQGGPPVAHAQMWRHLERLRRLFTEFFVSFSSSSGGDSGGPGGDSSDKETSPSSSEKGASLLVDYLLARYAGSPRSAGAGCQLQWLLLCQLPEYVTEVLGLRWLPANGLSGPVRVVSEPPPLPFSGLPLMAYLVLSDPESPGDGPAGAMAAGLRESSSSSSRCCDECKDSGIILETLDFLLVSRFGQQPASSSSSSSSCSSHNKEEEEFVQKKLQRYPMRIRVPNLSTVYLFLFKLNCHLFFLLNVLPYVLLSSIQK